MSGRTAAALVGFVLIVAAAVVVSILWTTVALARAAARLTAATRSPTGPPTSCTRGSAGGREFRRPAHPAPTAARTIRCRVID